MKYTGIGLMSGTSLDGLDICCAEYWKEDNQWKYKIIESKSVCYPKALKSQLEEAVDASGNQLTLLNIELGSWMGDAVVNFIDDYDLKPQFIGSHGHTIFHQPENNMTFQIGDGNVLHAKTNLPIVYNFRQLDILKGGQGAPLAPMGDIHLFSNYQFCLNLGGIANISKGVNENTVAFDICAVNMAMNYIVKRKNLEYDNKGMLAKEGKLIEPLLKKLNNLDYYDVKGPKSLGYEYVAKNIFPLLSDDYIMEDLLRTYVEHVSMKITDSLKTLNVQKDHKMLITGGGAYNDFLISRIMECADLVNVEVPDEKTIEFKEALIFGFLGLLRLKNEINILGSVTGANENSSAGDIIGTFQEK